MNTKLTKVVTKGRVSQSLTPWCLEATHGWTVRQTCEAAVAMGVPGVELVIPPAFGLLKEHGLVCPLTMIKPPGLPPFVRGWNLRSDHAMLTEITTASIDATSDAGFPNVIAFVGSRFINRVDPNGGLITDGEAIDAACEGLAKMAQYAESKGVTLCLELLNSVDLSHPMNGHQGYQGDNARLVMEIINGVNMPGLKLLFDFYHWQIMEGDVLRWWDKVAGKVGHVHVAGNPGRGPLETGELHYGRIIKYVADSGYKGFVGQEFMPFHCDINQALMDAVRLCDV